LCWWSSQGKNRQRLSCFDPLTKNSWVNFSIENAWTSNKRSFAVGEKLSSAFEIPRPPM
jgi:hypothetical protein